MLVSRIEVVPCHVCKGTGWIKLQGPACASCFACEATFVAGPVVAHNVIARVWNESWSNWQYVMMNLDPFQTGEWTTLYPEDYKWALAYQDTTPETSFRDI